jgi:glycosyltransferase involved in cell wall biosynthesis
MAESKDCILFSTADWDAPCWTNKQHTARHLAKQGYRVLYIESIGLRAPTVSSRDMSRIWRRLRRGLRPPQIAEPNVWVMSPMAIPFKHHWPLVRRMNQGLLRWRIKRFLQRTGFSMPIVWTYHPFVLETLYGFDHGQLVYHCVDDLSVVPGIDLKAFNAEEQRLLKRAAIVFTTSETLQKKCSALNANSHFLPNVADASHFGRAREPGLLPDDLAAIPQPRIGYLGVLSDYKVDFHMVLAVAKLRPDWHWIFIGEEREGQGNELIAELVALPNTHFLGYRPYSRVPDYLRGFDVATLPTLLNDYTRSMFPMKYFEYLAAGVPVVSTPLDFTTRYRGGMEIGADAKSFADAIAMQLKHGRLSDLEVLNALGDNTWDRRLGKMLGLLARG